MRGEKVKPSGPEVEVAAAAADRRVSGFEGSDSEAKSIKSKLNRSNSHEADESPKPMEHLVWVVNGRFGPLLRRRFRGND